MTVSPTESGCKIETINGSVPRESSPSQARLRAERETVEADMVSVLNRMDLELGQARSSMIVGHFSGRRASTSRMHSSGYKMWSLPDLDVFPTSGEVSPESCP